VLDPKNPPNRVALTPIFVVKTKPRSKAFNVWDLRCPGLCLRIQKSGFRSFKFVYSMGQRRVRWYHIGRVPLSDARRIADRLRVAVAEGKDPHGERRTQRDAVSFRQVADRYLEEYAKKRNRSWRKIRRLIEKHALPYIGDRPIQEVTRGDVKAVISRIKAPFTQNVTLASLSAIFSWATKEELATSNPCTGISKNPTRSRERVASDDEIRRLWAALTDMGSVEADVLKVCLLTGQRSSEVLSLRRQSVERSDGGAWWNIPGTARKGGNSHRVWLTGLALDIIGDGFDGAKRLDRVMQHACREANITPAIRPHDARRTFATLTARFFGREPVSRLLGHADKSVAAIYDRFSYDGPNKIIWEKISEHVIGLVDSVEQPRTAASGG
jgi:integrase